MSKHYPGTCLVLLVEDDGLVAFDLEDSLTNAGYKVAGPFSTCADALSWLKTQTPHMAVLDVMLNTNGPHP